LWLSLSFCLPQNKAVNHKVYHLDGVLLPKKLQERTGEVRRYWNVLERVGEAEHTGPLPTP
jgi:hypothetical protein